MGSNHLRQKKLFPLKEVSQFHQNFKIYFNFIIESYSKRGVHLNFCSLDFLNSFKDEMHKSDFKGGTLERAMLNPLIPWGWI